MTPLIPPQGERWICPKCTAVRGAHFLTCPVLRLPAGWPRDDRDQVTT